MSDVMPSQEARPGRVANLLFSLPMLAVHLAVVAVFWVDFSWTPVAAALGLYVVRMFGITAGYHRYFSHRTYKTSRAFQFLLAFLAQTSLQKGALWWAAHHRHHHKHSDEPADIHSPVQRGFWWSHVGWILVPEYHATRQDLVRDLTRYPELVWLDRWHWVPPLAYGVGLFLVGGWPLLVWGLVVSTVLLWHGTFVINSLAHVFGRRRYATSDDSRNSLLLALITLGEGWHNNHHHYQSSTSQGFFWWEVDVTFYVLKALEKLGLVWDLRRPPKHMLQANLVRNVARGLPVSLASGPKVA
jgi:stearoyl-CoA desaturase (delta-9 desaturase)